MRWRWRVPERARPWVTRSVAGLAAGLGVWISTAAPEAGFLAFVISLWAPLVGGLLPRWPDQWVAVPLWSFFYPCLSLLTLAHPSDSATPDDLARMPVFVFSLFMFTISGTIVGLDLRSARRGEALPVGRTVSLTSPGWGLILFVLASWLIMLLLLPITGI